MHLETTWLLQLIAESGVHTKIIAAVVRHGITDPPRWVSREGELWCLNELHEHPDMVRRATYLRYGLVEPWEPENKKIR